MADLAPQLSRTMSMSSKVLGSETGRTNASSGGGGVHDLERQLQNQRRQAADAASDTSSQRERKFAALLGGYDEEEEHDHPHPANVGHRLYYQGCGRQKAREERLRYERDRMLMVETAQLTQRPNITNRARSKPSKGTYFSEHASAWQERREHHVEVLARGKFREESRELTGTPQINPKSREILEHAGGHEGPVRAWGSHVAKFYAKRSEPVTPEQEFTPNINSTAFRPDGEKDIARRLYEDSAQRQERLRQMAHEQRKKEMVDPHTGRPLFQPHSLRSGDAEEATPARPTKRSIDALSAALHNDHREHLTKKSSVEQAPDANLTFQPHINPTSVIMAGRSGVRKPLYVRKAKRDETDRAKENKESGDGGGSSSSHHNRQRARSAEPSPQGDEFLRRIQRAELARSTKLEQIRAQQEERELAECSFHPRISRRSEDLFITSNIQGTPMQSPMETLQSQQSGGSAVSRIGVDGVTSLHSPHRGGSPHQAAVAAPPPPGYSEAQVAAARARLAASPVATTPGRGGGRFSSQQPSSSAGGNKKAGPTVEQEFEAAMAAANSPSAAQPPTASSAHRRQQHSPSVPSPRMEAGAPGGRVEPVDNYIASFEKQMYSVLEEWRKLEDV